MLTFMNKFDIFASPADFVHSKLYARNKLELTK